MNATKSADWLSIINAGWFGLLVGVIFSLTSIGIGYVLYHRAKQVSRVKYLIGDAPLIGPTPTDYNEGLEIRFDGQAVPLVTSTSFGIWNGGNVTVHGRDIVEADPLRLELEGNARILRCTLEATNRKVNGAEITQQEWKSVHFGFDYLDPGDGFRLQVIHSGTAGSVKSKGTLRGLPQGLEKYDPGRSFFRFIKFFIIVMLALSIPIIGTLLYGLGNSLFFGSTSQKVSTLLGLVAAGAVAFIASRMATKAAEPPRIKGAPEAVTSDPTLFSWPRTELRGPYG